MVHDTSILKLPWLRAAPEDFSARVKAAASPEDLIELSHYSLNLNQCEILGRAIQKIDAAASMTTRFSIGVLSNSTTDLLPNVFVVAAARYGIGLQVERTDFDQVMQAALGANNSFEGKSLDAILLALDERFFPQEHCETGVIESWKALYGQVVQGISSRFNVPLILQTIPDQGEILFGSADARQPGARRHSLIHLNQHIAEELCLDSNILYDVAGLAEKVGLQEWYDPVMYYMAKLPFAQKALPAYAEGLIRLIAAIKGVSKKCLVFDLDNTIWGGVIGDDGIEGIEIGQGSPAGEAFLHVQRVILNYHFRGIVLAVSSKNTHELAIKVFEEHDDMLIRPEHIAVFQANWQDKASNIRAIAKNLNLGLESFVFLDDNPMERQLVRETLPEVAVPELPDDPAYYPQVLAAAGYFEAVTFSEEDRRRNESYRANAQRIRAFEAIGNLDEYLRSLSMVATIKPLDDIGLNRVVQLINKTNQFNLTTRRHNRSTLESIMQDSSYLTMLVRLKDKFGDNGMIAVLIAKQAGAELSIDSFLMSCRVLERRVEYCLMNELVRLAKDRGVKRMLASYIPTDRNVIVENLYQDLGFRKADECGDTGKTEWELELESFTDHAVFITIEN